MVYTVTLNPAIDYYMKISELKPDVQTADSADLNYGGKGINVSVILANLGIETTALGFVGGHTGDKFCELLDKEGVKTDFVRIDGETRINVKIEGAANIIVNAKGPEITLSNEQELISKLSGLTDKDYLVLSGSVPSSMDGLAYERLIEAVRRPHTNLIADTTGEALKTVLKYNPFLVKPNHYELEDFLGRKMTTREDCIAGAVQLQKMGAKNVIVSLGKNGMILVTKSGEVFTEPVIDGVVKNTTGCGDSTVAGFIAGYLMSGDYKEALHLASICANATAFSSRLATREEIEALAKLYE